MIKVNKKLSLIIAMTIATTFFNCKNGSTDLNINNDILKIESKLNKYSLQGKVDLNDFQNNQFKTKTISINDIAKKASITIYYSSNHSDESLKNKPISATVTDESGSFNLNFSTEFNPNPNDSFILEASKRVGGLGKPFISLRTLVKWNGNQWESITENQINISKETTAFSIINHFESDSVKVNDLIDRIKTKNDGSKEIIYDEKITNEKLNNIVRAIDLLLFQELDPLGHIYSSIENYQKYEIRNHSTIKTNMHEVQTILETYAVDWGGVYPTKVIGLVEEAKQGNYWKEINNPFSNNSDEFLDYDEYQEIKNTLTFRGNKIEDLSDLKGYIVYKPTDEYHEYEGFTKYFIYGLDFAGQFLKKDANRLEDFALSNQ